MVLRTYLMYNTVVWLWHFCCCGGKVNFVQIFLLNPNFLLVHGKFSSRTYAIVSQKYQELSLQVELNVKRFLIKLPRFILKFSNTMQGGRLTLVFLFRHVGRATATGQYNVQIGHSYPYGTQTGLTSPGLI